MLFSPRIFNEYGSTGIDQKQQLDIRQFAVKYHICMPLRAGRSTNIYLTNGENVCVNNCIKPPQPWKKNITAGELENHNGSSVVKSFELYIDAT